MHWKIVSFFFTVVLMWVTFFPATMVAENAQKAIVEIDHLNVRSGPGTEYEKVDQVHTGDSFRIVQILGDWIEVKFKGETAWIANEYVSIQESSDQKEHLISERLENGSMIDIKHDQTHIRKKPSTDSSIIHFADRGDTFEVVAMEDAWVKIKKDKTEGYVKQRLLTSDISSYENPLKNKVIVIDVGHGGYDVGSIGVQGTYEKDLTLHTSKRLKEKLVQHGATALLTRHNDYYVQLSSRASLANSIGADLFVSIHYNSFPEAPRADGMNTYYYNNQQKQLAEHIQDSLVNQTNARDRGVDFGDYQVLRQNDQTAVLLELGFISNRSEENRLLTTSYHEKLVDGIIEGIRSDFTP